jgi:FdhD protein
MRIPGNDFDLTAGFLMTGSLANRQLNFDTKLSCGICGEASPLALRTICPPRTTNNFRMDAELLYSLPGRLRESQG